LPTPFPFPSPQGVIDTLSSVSRAFDTRMAHLRSRLDDKTVFGSADDTIAVAISRLITRHAEAYYHHACEGASSLRARRISQIREFGKSSFSSGLCCRRNSGTVVVVFVEASSSILIDAIEVIARSQRMAKDQRRNEVHRSSPGVHSETWKSPRAMSFTLTLFFLY